MANASDAVWLSVLPDMSGFGSALIKGVGKEADAQGKTIGKRFGSALNIGVAAIATGAVAAGTALYKIGESFDEARNTIRVGTGATGKDLDALMDNAKEVARRVPNDIGEIGTAIADLNTRLGLTGPVAEDFATQILQAGRITGEALDIDKVADSFKQYGIETEKYGDSLDHVFRVSQDTGVGMNDLLSTVTSSAPAAEALGLSFEETALMVGKLSNAGLDAENMTSHMARRLVNLAEEGEKPRETFDRVTKEIQSMVDAGDLFGAQDLANKAFGSRNAEKFVKAMQDGTFSLEELTDAAGLSSDTIAEASKDTMTFGDKWALFKNNVLVAVEPLATKLFDAIQKGMDWIIDNAVPALENMARWLGENSNWLMPLAGLIGGIVAVVKIWSAVQGILNAVLMANPIGLVIAAIAGLVAGVVLAYKKSETFRKVVDSVWSAIKTAIKTVWDFLKTKVFEPLVDWVKRMWERFQDARDKVTGAWDTMKAGLKAGWDWIDSKVIQPFMTGWNLLKDGFSRTVDTVKDIWEKIKAPFKAVWTWIDDNVIQKFKKGITNLKDHVNTMKDSIGNAWRGIANKFRDPINWVLDKVWNNGIAKAFNKAAGVLNLKTRISTEAQIPKFAKGGFHKGGWALVGEEGPELVNFDRPGRVYTAAETAQALGGVPGGIKGTDALPGMGEGSRKSLASRAWDGIKSVGSAVVGWVRGGLADAAGLILRPIRTLIQNTVSKWGTFGDLTGGMMTNSIDSLMEWIRNKDDVGDAGGIAVDMTGGKWRRPSRGPITSRYGRRYLFGGTFHSGIDIAGGGPTYAAAAGKVYKTGWNILGGRTGIGIGIDHGAGRFTYYGHNPSMAAVKVRPGDNVRAGQHIGAQGATGNVTGTHLHFEFHKGGWGRAVNPEQLGLFDNGGLLKPGMTAYHSTRMSKPDAVLTARQWTDIHALATSGGRGDVWEVTVEADMSKIRTLEELEHFLGNIERISRQKVGVRRG